jgi:hypothetical protein
MELSVEVEIRIRGLLSSRHSRIGGLLVEERMVAS